MQKTVLYLVITTDLVSLAFVIPVKPKPLLPIPPFLLSGPVFAMGSALIIGSFFLLKQSLNTALLYKIISAKLGFLMVLNLTMHRVRLDPCGRPCLGINASPMRPPNPTIPGRTQPDPKLVLSMPWSNVPWRLSMCLSIITTGAKNGVVMYTTIFHLGDCHGAR